MGNNNEICTLNPCPLYIYIDNLTYTFFQDNISKQQFSKLCQVFLNPSSSMKETDEMKQFVSYLENFLHPQSIQERLPPSDVVGNIRFSHPTLYVFPGGQGDSALFGINGFNMLIDGGFSRKACFWDFTRHLDRLDAILVTRLNDENTQGISAVLDRKAMHNVYPQIGHFFANLVDDKGSEAKDFDEKDQLLVNVIHQGNSMMENLRILNLKPQICFRDNMCDPINLYHKVGHGKLDMYVLNPSKDSREVKEFLSRWNDNSGHLGDLKSGINVDGKELWLPIANLVSICALLIWQPANPNDTMTRLLFPGSTPQHKIFKGLEKLKKLECLKYPTCSASTLQQAKSKPRKYKENNLKKERSSDANKERQEKIARLKQEKMMRANEERDRIEKEKREEKERREKEKQEKMKEKDRIEKERRKERERREKEKQEKLEKKEKAEKEKEKIQKDIGKSEKEKEERREKEKKERAEKEKEKIQKDNAEREKRKKKDKEKQEMLLKQKEEKEKKEKEKRERRERKEKSKKDALLQKEKDDKEKSNLEAESKIDKPKKAAKDLAKKSSDASKSITKKASDTKSKISSLPASKLKKEENNKKVMETRKAAAAASKQDGEKKAVTKRIVGGKNKSKKPQADLDAQVDDKKVSEKVTEAIAAGLIDNARVVTEEEEDKVSIVEKDQIEAMENVQENIDKDFKFDDDIEAELQHIGIEDDQHEVAPVPDIGEKLQNNDFNLELKENAEKVKVKEDKVALKMAYSHVKTPDEVDDLPEHEVVPHEVNPYAEDLVEETDNRAVEEEENAQEADKDENLEQLIADACVESKIAKDENEKEQIDKEEFEENVEGDVEASKEEQQNKDVISFEEEQVEDVKIPDNAEEVESEGKSNSSAENVKGEEEVIVAIDKKEIEKDHDSTEPREEPTEKYTKEILEKDFLNECSNEDKKVKEDDIDGTINSTKPFIELSKTEVNGKNEETKNAENELSASSNVEKDVSRVSNKENNEELKESDDKSSASNEDVDPEEKDVESDEKITKNDIGNIENVAEGSEINGEHDQQEAVEDAKPTEEEIPKEISLEKDSSVKDEKVTEESKNKSVEPEKSVEVNDEEDQKEEINTTENKEEPPKIDGASENNCKSESSQDDDAEQSLQKDAPLVKESNIEDKEEIICNESMKDETEKSASIDITAENNDKSKSSEDEDAKDLSHKYDESKISNAPEIIEPIEANNEIEDIGAAEKDDESEKSQGDEAKDTSLKDGTSKTDTAANIKECNEAPIESNKSISSDSTVEKEEKQDSSSYDSSDGDNKSSTEPKILEEKSTEQLAETNEQSEVQTEQEENDQVNNIAEDQSALDDKTEQFYDKISVKASEGSNKQDISPADEESKEKGADIQKAESAEEKKSIDQESVDLENSSVDKKSTGLFTF